MMHAPQSGCKIWKDLNKLDELKKPEGLNESADLSWLGGPELAGGLELAGWTRIKMCWGIWRKNELQCPRF